MKFIFLEAVQSHGGARKSTLELAKRLKGEKNDVLIVDFWGSCLEFKNEAIEYGLQFKVLDSRQAPIVLKNSKCYYRVLLNYIIYFFYWIRYRRRIKLEIDSYEPDFVFINNLKTLSILQRRRKYKTIYMVRTWLAPSSNFIITRIMYRILVDAFIGVSQATTQALVSSKVAKIENVFVLPNAISMPKIRLAAQDELNQSGNDAYKSKKIITILHCGGFLPTKGQHITIEIAKILKERNIDFKIILMGLVYDGVQSHQYYNEILKDIRFKQLNDNVEILLNQSEIIPIFTKADLLIHPSSTEGLPRVIMEAMALKKPVIANAVGGVTDYILDGYTGLLAHFNDVDDYVEKIIFLIDNPGVGEKMAENAYCLIRDTYSEVCQMKKLNKIIDILKKS